MRSIMRMRRRGMRMYERKMMGHKSEKQKAREEIISGISITAVFGFLFVFFRHGFPWMIFPLVFAGVIPLIRGLTRIRDFQQIDGPREKKITSKKDAEKAILRIAHGNSGKVSATLIAMETTLTIEEAEKYLGDLAGRGHASMNVRDNGTIEYVFNDLLPGGESGESL